MTNKYLIVSEKKWHEKLFINLKNNFKDFEWVLINNKENLNLDFINEISPTKIFIPHWSYLIPEEIYNKFECIVFHMTDLPFGRGGSPLQNLIVRGFKSTKISALKVEKGLDTGEIYLKKPLNLNGSAKEIFERASIIIEGMINEIISKNCKPIQQKGEIVEFKRRKPEESNITHLTNLNDIYDYIRMLDCEGYPNAFLELSNIRFEFNNATFDQNKNIISANVRITKK
jgi:methionyl-tRNA formyltransferase